MTAALTLRVPEADFQAGVIQFAQLHGWRVAAFRPSRTERGWRTAVSADGAGWPDLSMARGPRLLFAELKAIGGRVRNEQRVWLDVLRQTPAEVYLWTPADWPEIQRVLTTHQPPQETPT